ncbi:hypothetical protein BJY01DRAFT_245746 [Aspergillus pseudoustus]|uniref:Kinesin light chain n=1 Tax=Aspergillus pseudoustus TaxID=1810923 RepID=A0ABR4KCD5_9EURO
MASRHLSHVDFSIAWICALPLEIAAAKLVLDAVHDSLPQPAADQNCYTLGEVSGHNVVIACLPSGVYGTVSATTVLVQMLPTFRPLRFGLMVGIGGGVPTKVDVRLGDVGDVVVGIPSASSTGVIQFDFGKTLHSGDFIDEIKVEGIICSALEGTREPAEEGAAERRREAIRENFSRPDLDRLFDSTYSHQNPATGCSSCDSDRLVHRERRQSGTPRIHYSSIASGNQVMKDAQTRDSIAAELEVLCFEMEAAGLMDQLPCLAIRGICDYCDSHKSKEWQGYGALAAAAYAKVLLKVVPMHSAAGMALCGLGGIGKTQIALEVAYRIREKDPEVSIFWIPCTSYESVEQGFLKLAQRVGLEHADTAALKQRVKTFLDNTPFKWLLIFDNADDMEMWTKGSETVPPLKDILPHNEKGRVLFTIRNRNLAVKLVSSKVVQVADMDKDTTLDMLDKLLIDKALLEDQQVTATLLEQLCFLPLAISQAAAYIKKNGISLSDYLSLLANQEADTVELLSENFEDDGRYSEIQNPVITTWLIFFDQVRQVNKLAVEYLSFMAPLGLLKAYSFISEHIDTGLVTLNRLVHLATRNWMRRDQFFAARILESAAWMDELFKDFGEGNLAKRELWRLYLPHAISLTQSDEFKIARRKFTSLLRRVGLCLLIDGRAQEANRFYTDVSETLEKEGGIDNEEIFISRTDIAKVLMELGKYHEACQVYEQVLEGRRALNGSSHPETLMGLRNLGYALERVGNLQRAQSIQLEAVRGLLKVHGPRSFSTLSALAGLATVLRSRGDFKGAEASFRHVMAGYETLFGPQHQQTLSIKTAITMVLADQGKLHDAEELLQQILKAYEELFEPDHPFILEILTCLGAIYSQRGKLKQAKEILTYVAEASDRVHGAEHLRTLVRYNSLALVLGSQHRNEEAMAVLQKVVQGSNKALGPQHPSTLVSTMNLALRYHAQGDSKEAEELLERVLEDQKRVIGEGHLNTLRTKHHLAVVLACIGEFDKALQMMMECLESCTQRLGHSYPEVQGSRETLERLMHMKESRSLGLSSSDEQGEDEDEEESEVATDGGMDVEGTFASPRIAADFGLSRDSAEVASPPLKWRKI